jgi:outer membrane protein OmpA-like peptidoglycan-associated protein
MASPNENPPGSPQLKGLVDLLIDLQLLNPRQESKKASPPSQEEASDGGESFSSQMEKAIQPSHSSSDAFKGAIADTLMSIGALSSPTLEPETKQSNQEKEPHTEPEISLEKAELELETKENSQEKEPHTEIEISLEKAELEPNDENEREAFVESANELIYPSPPLPLSSSSSLTDDSSSVVEAGQNNLSHVHQQEQQQEKPKNKSLLSQVVAALQDRRPESLRQEQRKEEPINPSIQPERELSHHQNSDTASEQAFKGIIQSHWQKTRQNQFANLSTGSTSPQDVENSIALFERWQRLLLTQEVMDSRQALAEFKQKLESLDRTINEPTELTNLLLPLIAEILSLKVAQARDDVAHAIAPVVDDMIQRRAQQDIIAISTALAPVIPEAVAKQVLNSPGDLAKALGPEMGTAIKEQIALERDAMVDALYPVIGSTISKYMAEAIAAINKKVENAFSLEGISRKVRAKLQGISEAELILMEAVPFTIQAIFLIHKGSGLVIAEVQPSDNQRLESEMVAGMLTAIRSFVNDVIVQTGEISEIDEIDYGDSKIILEVAGYCYLAAVIKGEPPKSFVQQMRSTLSTIVQRHGKPIELFDGDPDNVPEVVHQLLDKLKNIYAITPATKTHVTPVGLIIIGLVAMTAISLPVGIYQHTSSTDRRREAEISQALSSDPELAVYRLGVDANFGTIKLSGKLPNQHLRSRAEQVAKNVEPKLKIQNTIIPVEVPPDPVLAAAEVKRVTNLLNQLQGAVIEAEYSEGVVTVKGAVLQESDAQKITQAFLQIPGVKSVANTVQLQPMAIASRVYFDQGSSEIKSDERPKIAQIRAFLAQHPNKHLKLLGHTDPKGTTDENQQLALERAKKVKEVLVAQGVDAKRLHAEGTIEPPIGVNSQQIPLLSRCVDFKIMSP